MKTLIRAAALLALFLAVSLNQVFAQNTLDVRIGYQRGSLYNVPQIRDGLKAALEQGLGESVNLTLTPFTSGPPLLQALNSGGIDLGATGDAPVVFALAADTPLVIVASQVSAGGSAILVPQDSPIKTVADLKGKKVAYTIGSSANFFTIQALKTAGLAITDIQTENLQPGDARAAFDGGSIDAWAIWDPYRTIAITGSNARSIFDSSQLGPTQGYQEASVAFAHDHSDALQIVLDQYQKAIEWARQNPDDFDAYLEKETTVPAATWKQVYQQYPVADLEYITPAVVAEEQAEADVFYQLKLIPKAIDVSTAVWTPAGLVPPTAEASASPTAKSTSQGS
jgi:sulfonate transport system substrate-binding protein